MNFKILASTGFDNEGLKDRFNVFSGELAGICYMQNDFDSIKNQPLDKKLNRANMIKENGHHSVFDHEYVTLYFEDVPKFFAMLLNNEKMYTTSEKSARYTKMTASETEMDLYGKWIDIFKALINKKYPDVPYLTDKRIEKLAQENARYFISVFTPTSFAYTVSFRQLNYLYHWLKEGKNQNEYMEKIEPTINNFLEFLEKNGLIDEKISNFAQKRKFSLFSERQTQEYFGDVYSTAYSGSLASLAQAERHRTLSYSFSDYSEKCFYVPKIIEKSEKLKAMWLSDMKKVATQIPQGTLVEISEKGTLENFALKCGERLCTCAQLEIQEQTKTTLEKYIAHAASEEIKNTLLPLNRGARCLNGFACKSPCAFPEGVRLEREI